MKAGSESANSERAFAVCQRWHTANARSLYASVWLSPQNYGVPTTLARIGVTYLKTSDSDSIVKKKYILTFSTIWQGARWLSSDLVLVRIGDTVKIHCKGMLEDGRVFHNTKNSKACILSHSNYEDKIEVIDY